MQATGSAGGHDLAPFGVIITPWFCREKIKKQSIFLAIPCGGRWIRFAAGKVVIVVVLSFRLADTRRFPRLRKQETLEFDTFTGCRDSTIKLSASFRG